MFSSPRISATGRCARPWARSHRRLYCYDRVIDEDTGSASDKIFFSQSEPQPSASQTETASRAERLIAESASGEKQTQTASAAKVSRSQKALFGMSVEEQLLVIQKEVISEEIEQIDAGVSELRYSGTSKAVITLDNCHVWQ